MAYDHRPIYLECAMNYGVWSGDTPPDRFYGPINITKLETTPIKQESDDLISNIAGTVGQALESVQKATETGSMSMEFNSMPKELLELVLGADMSAFSQTAAAVTATIDTEINAWVDIGTPYLSSVGFALATAADAAVDAGKYAVDYDNGLIMALDPAAAGMGMKVTATSLAAVAENYEAGKAKSAFIQLRGRAYNKRTEKWGRLLVLKANLSNSQAYDWVKGGWAAGTLTGKILTPPGYSAPLVFQLRTA